MKLQRTLIVFTLALATIGRCDNSETNTQPSHAQQEEPLDINELHRLKEQRQLREDDELASTTGVSGFWLAYEATKEDIAAITAAEQVQHSIDLLSLEMEMKRSAIREAYLAQRRHHESTRDAALDRIPMFWSQLLDKQKGFREHRYWMSLDDQNAWVAASRNATDDRLSSIAFVPIDDEAMLRMALGKLRMLRIDGTHEADEGFDVIKIELSFGDAPSYVSPMVSRQLHKTIAVSPTHRFASFGSDAGDDADTMIAKGRSLGLASSSLEWSYETWQQFQDGGAPVRLTPVPGSFFELFAASNHLDELSLSEWKALQVRLGSFFEDVKCLFVEGVPAALRTDDWAVDHAQAEKGCDTDEWAELQAVESLRLLDDG